MRPETETDLAEMVAAASGPLHIRGGSTRGQGTPVGAVLETGGLSGITLYEPGALTMVAQAGTPLAEIEAALDAENQRLAFEPMDHRPLLGTTGTPTIGGVVAANVSGPRRIQAGACRDFMLGVRFVDGRGNVIKNGGRVMKNVTGYDLVKLLTGSRGTLGILSEVSFKVLPKPEFSATLCLHGQDVDAAVRAMAQAAGSPYEVTGLAVAPLASGEVPVTLMRLEGFETSVRYRLGAVRTLMAGQAEMTTLEGAQSAEIWEGVRDVAAFAQEPGDVWRISVTPGDAPGMIARMGKDAHTLLDWAGGLIWVRVAAGTDLRARLGGFSGHATLVRGGDATRASLPVFHPEPAPLAQISAGLRARFDPRGILNPGLMGA
ncbi:FAD-binding protein [Thalassococcus sp. BH17M4-6]|uniref:FAD-binding protein n=1 Tax=Thalassococcus sp. BH17M4-6 TaxID=3413148 RepID=UPI003BD49259